ncbi:hypothetical protein L6164_033111 [Bauhinia variegata]|uniref:Uncharacterized protein n=1 Tax=Bauhinia variegata TaxID=167791 RepID=A0ACB9KQT7_BAUVA|nr:hypothetical protein L6164_033111 [Bauhinia variegata]
MARKNKRNKEEVGEDWCFTCKDGGLLMICEFRNCIKAYHTACVGRDDSFLETGDRWVCGRHYCFLCNRASKFQCYCCPLAVCGCCIFDAEFAVVKGNKGFCIQCLRIALLIEENVDVDSDGGKVDFQDGETYECLFAEYYKVIKEKEGLNTQHVRTAHNLIKKGKYYKCDTELNEISEEEDEEADEDSDLVVVSDYGEAKKKSGIKKKYKRKCKSGEGRVKDKKMDFIGWGSRSLIAFLDHIGKDTSKEISQNDVASIIVEYCKENNLYYPGNKKKILCNEQLRSLLRRKSMNRNSIYNRLTPHFAENFYEMEDDMTSDSDERDEIGSVNQRKQRKLTSNIKSHEDQVSEEHLSNFAAIVTPNLKLVYLKRSLVVELSKGPETFDGKVMGSFVRVKSDPNDYLQDNPYQLVQVTGIKRSSRNGEINEEILLQLSGVPKHVPICKISDDDFSKEECEDLHRRMKNGLLKQPTIVELEQKARSLHEDITKHWIERELVLLQNRIDHANEKGWRRELYEYMNQKLELEKPEEQSRLLSHVPKVIPDVLDIKLTPDNSEGNDFPEFADGGACNNGNSKVNSSAGYQNDGTAPKSTAADDVSAPAEQNMGTLPSKQFHFELTPKVRQRESKAAFSEELTMESGSCDERKSRNSMNAERTIQDKKRVPMVQLLESSDDEERDANVPEGKQVVEDPESCIWHCFGPYGERRGPLSMSVLKRWCETSSYAPQFKVWKRGQSEEEAIPLPKALAQIFPSM